MKIVDVYVDSTGWGIQVIVEIRPDRYPGTLVHHIVNSEPCWPIFVCIGNSLLDSKEVRYALYRTKEYYDRTKRLVLFSVDQSSLNVRMSSGIGDKSFRNRPYPYDNLIQQQFSFIWGSAP